MSYVRRWIVLLDRDIRSIFTSLESPRINFTIFNMQGLMSFSPIVWGFLCLVISNVTSYDAFTNTMLSCWKLPVRSSLWRLQLVSCRRKNSKWFLVCSECIVSKWRLSFEGFMDSWLKTTLHNTHCGFPILLLVKLVKPNFRYSTVYSLFFPLLMKI